MRPFGGESGRYAERSLCEPCQDFQSATAVHPGLSDGRQSSAQSYGSAAPNILFDDLFLISPILVGLGQAFRLVETLLRDHNDPS